MLRSPKLDIYNDVAEDFVYATLAPFLPYDQGLNPVGDKTSSKKEIFEDFGLLTVSMDTDKNLLEEMANLLKVSGNKLRYNTMKKKSEACSNALTMVLHQTVYSEYSAPGRLIRSLTGNITEMDSIEMLQRIESKVVATWNAVYCVYDSLSNENEAEKFLSKESKMFISAVLASPTDAEIGKIQG